MTGHRYIPTQPVNRPTPTPNPTLLDRAVARVGADFPSVGAVLHAGLVGAA